MKDEFTKIYYDLIPTGKAYEIGVMQTTTCSRLLNNPAIESKTVLPGKYLVAHLYDEDDKAVKELIRLRKPTFHVTYLTRFTNIGHEVYFWKLDREE